MFKQEWKRQASVALTGYFQTTKNPILEFLTDEDGHRQVWIPKQYDFNVYSREKAVEKLEYMHQNPVVRELVTCPADWAFSSARWYVSGRSVGVQLTHIND